ncbi:hypothetical protein EUX98_g1540 [Antrodiella citrinella]|uniref:BTB domain-containing protein n=1 Tax=Antrodiella citrinella TaxID=2447956 RepID=A0A4S4N1A6_9APHY|nr:hypothetical protein EUX98_g1540 [Antrodiella citrinella]
MADIQPQPRQGTYSSMPVATTSPRANVAAKYYELAIRHVTLYDPTGDVVLVARGSDGVRQLFRVHSTAFGRWGALLKALKAHGNVYYRTSGGVENGPCVEMDDKADDVAAFLTAHVLEATEVLNVWGFSKSDPMVPLKIGSILRISHKYCFDSLSLPLRRFFSSAWPQSLDDWDVSECKFDLLASGITEHSTIPKRYAEDDFPEAASAIRLALDVNMSEILPAAFYHLSRVPVSHNWDARRRPSSPRSSRFFTPATRSAKWDLLTTGDLIRVLHGREKIHEFMVDNWADSVVVACHASCSEPSRECSKRYHDLTSLHAMLSENARSNSSGAFQYLQHVRGVGMAYFYG